MGPLTMFQRLVRDWKYKLSPQDISTKVKVGTLVDLLPSLFADHLSKSDSSTFMQ